MCTGPKKTMILTKLLPRVEYHGIFIKMPSGNHLFSGLYSKPVDADEKKLRPMINPAIDKMLGEMAFNLIKVSALNPAEGEFVSEFVGTKDAIWAEKINLDDLRMTQVA